MSSTGFGDAGRPFRRRLKNKNYSFLRVTTGLALAARKA